MPGQLSIESSEDQGEQTRRKIRWGYEVAPNQDKITCIKLFVDQGDMKPIVVPEFVSVTKTIGELARNHRTVNSAIADFLHELYKHAMEHLTRRWGAAFMRSTKMKFVFTVPACFTDRARSEIRKAAELAGFDGDLNMISEASQDQSNPRRVK